MVWVPFLDFYLELRPIRLVRFALRPLGRIWPATGLMSVAAGIPLWLTGYALVFVPVFVLLGIVFLAVLLRLLGAITAETATTLLQVLPRWLHGARHVVYWMAPAYRVEAMPPTRAASLSYQR